VSFDPRNRRISLLIQSAINSPEEETRNFVGLARRERIAQRVLDVLADEGYVIAVPKPSWPPASTRAVKPCGTYAAAQRHRRNGEDLCDVCVAAERKYNREAKRRNRY
jgi:hypothetical protein